MMDYEENDLFNQITSSRGGRSNAYSDMYDPNYIKMVEKTTYFLIYREKIMEMVLSLFEWKNIPDSMNSRYLEETLHRQGDAVIARHKKTGDVCNFRLANRKGELDIYGEPIIFGVTAHDYHDETLDKSEAVIMYNNRIRRSTFRVINHIAFKLAEADLIISQNMSAQSSPVLITGPEHMKKDLLALYRAKSNFVPIITGDKKLSDEVEIKVLNTDVPYIIDKIDTHKHVIWNEGMTFLGVDNANQEKKQRMITGEIDANDTQINMFRQSMMMERVKGAEAANLLFGTNIEVEFNDGVMDNLAELMTMANIEQIKSMTELNQADAELKLAQASQPVEVDKKEEVL